MARRPPRLDQREERVAIAVRRKRHDALGVATSGTLVPETTPTREIVHLAGGQRSLHGLPRAEGDHEDTTRDGVLRDDRDDAAALVEIERLEQVRLTHAHGSSTSAARTTSASAKFVAIPPPPNAVDRPVQSVN